jgi:hypothetical protein
VIVHFVDIGGIVDHFVDIGARNVMCALNLISMFLLNSDDPQFHQYQQNDPQFHQNQQNDPQFHQYEFKLEVIKATFLLMLQDSQ